ncbi:MAG TPA: YihA family ribosome biogenesis GTP-binding protein [Acholeplasmataceae bacterium]|nr:YihA family ribosome biogenesis GTP-binding protein [Acholeplasmataceae bacterium]HBO68110.1 YihA family ribosome biogenesis GTP-binding protein [Acholeplasmataceae bacterium]HBS01461.1 YihA family ribosome biogenesis GTP-binding protein [Acholeplasmataceae bacterium]HCB20779.1 YihA family ribosome biogenesis GTP-binding protein [Acholeplasmataceae bacterium]HCZ23748.1 YihA family ribosome biogenesis GTP-binding protein [Acholeplasmataceae bacterium]
MEFMIKQAVYVKSVTDLKDEPEGLPQILMIGRSNVGKSSFINALTNRKSLARVSNTPGKTITLNFYLIDQTFYLVDAPGYGYARRSKSMQDQFIIMIQNYIKQSNHLRMICMLIDFKVGPTDDDLFTYQFLVEQNLNVMVVATKKDKVPKTHQFKQEQAIKKLLKNPVIFYAYSSVTKDNLDLIENEIRNQVSMVE